MIITMNSVDNKRQLIIKKFTYNGLLVPLPLEELEYFTPSKILNSYNPYELNHYMKDFIISKSEDEIIRIIDNIFIILNYHPVFINNKSMDKKTYYSQFTKKIQEFLIMNNLNKETIINRVKLNIYKLT